VNECVTEEDARPYSPTQTGSLSVQGAGGAMSILVAIRSSASAACGSAA